MCYLDELANRLRHPTNPTNLTMMETIVDDIMSHLERHEDLVLKNIELVSEVVRTFTIIITAPPLPELKSYYDHLVIRSLTQATEIPFLSGQILFAPFNALALRYLGRFEEHQALDDLRKSVGYYAQALSVTSDEITPLPKRLNRLGDAYSKQFLQSGESIHIDIAIECYTLLIDLTPSSDDYRRHLLNNLGTCHTFRLKISNRLDDLNNAIEYWGQALLLAPEDDPRLKALLSNCSVLYERRFHQLDQIDDISKAIECLARVVLLLLANNPELVLQLERLARFHRIRFDRQGDPSDLDLTIRYFHQAIADGAGSLTTLASCANELGLAYHARFRYKAEVDDIENAIKYLTQAIRLIPQDNSNVTGFLSNLGNAHQWRFERLADPLDIEKAIEYQAVAVASTDKKDRSFPGNLNNLGLSYKLRFERQGGISDIDKAIELQIQAVALSPNSHPNLVIHISNLASSYDSRYGRLHDVKDVDAAIKLHAQALELTPSGHVAFPGRLSNLAGAYKLRFDHLQNVSDLNAAIEHRTRAILLTPQNNAEFPLQASNLGMLHLNRFRRHGNPIDLQQCIELFKKAVVLTPENHSRLPNYLGNLAAAHQMRFLSLKFREPNDGQIPIELYSRALKTTLAGSLSRTTLLEGLGRAYTDQWEINGSESSLEAAIQAFREVIDCEAGYPYTKFAAACQWGDIATRGARKNALQAYQIALELLPRIIWLGTTIDQRYEDIQSIGRLATKAAAVAISAHEYKLAVEWLEQGRSIVWNQTLQLRTPIEELHTLDPTLAIRLQELSEELHNLGSEYSVKGEQTHDSPSPEQVAQKHRRLAEEYERILVEVRKKTGFTNFLRPRKFEELVNACRTGPIVIVNIHELRCDALVLRKELEGVNHVPLPNISASNITGAHKLINQYLSKINLRENARIKFKQIGSTPSENHFERVLASLWNDLVKPVLESLEYSPTSDIDQLPHITWCLTGPLSFLPLHAAGLYTHPKARISDYAITSYAPTISSLLQVDSNEPINGSSLLAVGQEATPGQNPLPGTNDELAGIERLVTPPIQLHRLEGQNATTGAVLEAIERHDWVHFACHAHQNLRKPTESGFILHDDTLTLKAIGKRAFKGKGLAFLSACQTAQGDDELPDESVHLASGMLTAGYPSVIATMWSVVDVDAPVIANSVYEHILEGGRMNSKGAAKALHIAINLLRESVGEKAFARWAPYIHIGR